MAEAGDGAGEGDLDQPSRAFPSILIRLSNTQLRRRHLGAVGHELDRSNRQCRGFEPRLLSGLTNGHSLHAFEVRAFRDSEVGATATVSATPLAAVCNT